MNSDFGHTEGLMSHGSLEGGHSLSDYGDHETRAPQADSSSPSIQEIVTACEDGKGIDVNVIHVARRFGLADNFIVVSGRSDRHAQGIAYRVLKLFEDRGLEPFGVSGLEEGQWIVIDAIDTVVHIFYEPMRKHYDLEGLWAE